MNKYEVILNDTFDIANRLKNIDENYVLKWNKIKKRYELFLVRGKQETLELVLPFYELDERTITYVNKTRVENYKALLIELEKNNERLEKQSKNEVLDKAKEELKGYVNYFNKNSASTLELTKTNQTKWV